MWMTLLTSCCVVILWPGSSQCSQYKLSTGTNQYSVLSTNQLLGGRVYLLSTTFGTAVLAVQQSEADTLLDDHLQWVAWCTDGWRQGQWGVKQLDQGSLPAALCHSLCHTEVKRQQSWLLERINVSAFSRWCLSGKVSIWSCFQTCCLVSLYISARGGLIDVGSPSTAIPWSFLVLASTYCFLVLNCLISGISWLVIAISHMAGHFSSVTSCHGYVVIKDG